MALFSFRHSVKTFSPKCENTNRLAARGQTAAHLRYITRGTAARVVIRQRLEGSTDAEQAELCETAAEKRKGRACERFIIALPVEASADQRVALAREFAETLTNGHAGYVLAIHDKSGNDRLNPHFHLVAFDRHLSSGGRGRPRSVLGMARKNAVEKRAAQWAALHNRMMLAWGHDASSQISHLSYATRGIDRIPEIHEGPAAKHMHLQGKPHATKSAWKHVDAGGSRRHANIVIREINTLKKEYQNARADRLGEGSSGNAPCRDGGCKIVGEDHWRSGGGPFPPTRAAGNQCSTEGRAGSDRYPPWEHGGRTGQQRARPQQPPFIQQANHIATPVAHHRGAGRRGISRIFHELIMLRDTLRARLATRAGRHRALPDSLFETVRDRGLQNSAPPRHPPPKAPAWRTR